MKYILVATLMIACFSAQTATLSPTPPCTEVFQKVGNTQIHRQVNSHNECWLTIDPIDSDESLVYRNYLISSNGLFMVFNSYGEGPDQEMTGAREFYFFPRKNSALNFKVNEAAKTITVEIATNQTMIFSTETAEIQSLSQAVVTVDKKVLPTNKGGVSIKNNQAGIFLDCGFQKGASPTQNPYSTCSFVTSQNQTCAIMNHRLFNYIGDDNTLRSDKELMQVYDRFCKARQTARQF